MRHTYDTAPPGASVVESDGSANERSDDTSSSVQPSTTMVVTKPQQENPGSSGSTIRTANDAWRIKARDVTLGKKLGQGAFGIVWKGKWHSTTVAVKQLKLDNTGGEEAHSKAMAEFANEIGRMASMQQHEHVVRLFGVTTLDNGNMAAVVEYCSHGSVFDVVYGE